MSLIFSNQVVPPPILLVVLVAVSTFVVHAENPTTIVPTPSRSTTKMAGYDSDGHELRRDAKGVVWGTDGETWWLSEGPDGGKPKMPSARIPALLMPQTEVNPALRTSDYELLLGERAKLGPRRAGTEQFYSVGLPGTGIHVDSEGKATLHVLCGPSRSQFVSCR